MDLATLLVNVRKDFFPLEGTSGTDSGILTPKNLRNESLSKFLSKQVFSIPNFWYCSRFSGRKYLCTLPTGDDLAGDRARGGVCGPEGPESGEAANDVDMVVVK